MADKTTDQLVELTTLDANDLLLAYDVSEVASEKIKKITKTNAFAGVGGGEWSLIESATDPLHTYVFYSISDASKRYKMISTSTPVFPSHTHATSHTFNNDYTQAYYDNYPVQSSEGWDSLTNTTNVEKWMVDCIFDVPNKLIFGHSCHLRSSGDVLGNHFYIRWIGPAAVTQITSNLYDATNATSNGTVTYKIYMGS